MRASWLQPAGAEGGGVPGSPPAGSPEMAAKGLERHAEAGLDAVVAQAGAELAGIGAVSYTHLDVYKRQGLGSGLWDGIGWSHFSTPRIVPAWYIAQILNQKEAYYFSHYSQESRYYHDPQTTRGMVEPLVNKLIPESGKFLGYVRDLLETLSLIHI